MTEGVPRYRSEDSAGRVRGRPEYREGDESSVSQVGRVRLNSVQVVGFLTDTSKIGYDNPRFSLLPSGTLKAWSRLAVMHDWFNFGTGEWEVETTLLAASCGGMFADVLYRWKEPRLCVSMIGSLQQIDFADSAGLTRRVTYLSADSVSVCEPFTNYVNELQMVCVICRPNRHPNPDLRVGNDGRLFGLVRVAVSKWKYAYKDTPGHVEWVFLTVRVSGWIADLVQRYAVPGREMLVYGNLTNHRYTMPHGEHRCDVEVRANYLAFLDRKIPDGPDVEIRNPLGKRGMDLYEGINTEKIHDRPGSRALHNGYVLCAGGINVPILESTYRRAGLSEEEIGAGRAVDGFFEAQRLSAARVENGASAGGADGIEGLSANRGFDDGGAAGAGGADASGVHDSGGSGGGEEGGGRRGPESEGESGSGCRFDGSGGGEAAGD